MLNTIKYYFEWVCIIWTVFTILWWFLSFLNIMPFYQVKLYKVNSITPTINLFPASKIRLNFDFHKAASKEDIISAEWYLLKDNKKLFQVNGLEPTVTLPPTEGGIYQLQIIATTKDNQIETGEMNFYVVQDIAKQVVCSLPIKFDITPENYSPEFIARSQSKGVEVFNGDKQWVKVENLSVSKNKVTAGFKSNETFSTFNNQIPIRVQGSPNELSNYATIHLPNQCLMFKQPTK